MGLFNEHSSTNTDTSTGVQGQPGPQGPPGVGYKLDANGNYNIENKKLINVKPGTNNDDVVIKSQIQYIDGVLPAQVTKNKAVIYSPSGSIHTNDLYLKDKNGQEVHFYNSGQDLNQCRLYIPNLKNNDSYGGRLKSDIMVTSIDQTIQGKKIFHDIEVPTPTIDGHASNKAYVDNSNAANKIYIDSEISKIPNIDTTSYLKKDGSEPMTGNLQMNNNRITNLPFPVSINEPTTLGFVNQLNNNLLNYYLDLAGSRKMKGDINMDNHLIKNLKSPLNESDAVNKGYTDSQISKANIKPSHNLKNAFKYLMSSVNEWSSEYNVKVENFTDLAESPHYWDKRVLNITPIKDGKNYRFRLGLQMFPLKTNESYSLIIELCNRDFKTWQRQETYINGTGVWVENSNTTKFQHRYGSSGDLYYTKTLVKFKKTSSSAPIFIYFTVHFDDNGGDMNTYPKDFINQVYILAYGIIGETDHVDSEVYDAHQAFEIDKTKMKMLVPLDMNNNAITNISNISLDGHILIHGIVNQNKFFTTSNINLQFRNIKMGFIKLHPKRNIRNKNDTIKILNSVGNAENYHFWYTHLRRYTQVNINRYFSRIESIQLTNEINMGFQIGYSLFY